MFSISKFGSSTLLKRADTTHLVRCLYRLGNLPHFISTTSNIPTVYRLPGNCLIIIVSVWSGTNVYACLSCIPEHDDDSYG